MKPGHHLPKDDRDDMARLAFAFTKTMSGSDAVKTVTGLFQVSDQTARNLISRGLDLARKAEEASL